MNKFIELKYIEAVETAIKKGRSIGYHPTRFKAMIEKEGHVRASEILLDSKKIHDGFTTLYMKGQIELTIEYIVAKNPEFHELFTSEEVETAKRKIE